MKIIVCFRKSDNVKYISHLDLQRSVDRALRRSGIEVVYSCGFNPHIQMSFAFALKVGLTSENEYLEVEVADHIDIKEAETKIMDSFPNGIDVNWVREKKPGVKKLMASVAMSRYDIMFENEADMQVINQAIENVLAMDEVVLTKKTKKGPKVFDARPLIFKLEVDEQKKQVYALLSAQEKGTLDPKLLMDKILLEVQKDYRYIIKRKNLYTVIEKKLYPLSFLAKKQS